MIVRKGFHAGIDSYSAFRENDRMTRTGLDGYLKARGFTRLVLCGLALDYCVAWSAIDARQAGFDVAVVVEATAAIDLDGSRKKMLAEMRQARDQSERDGLTVFRRARATPVSGASTARMKGLHLPDRERLSSLITSSRLRSEDMTLVQWRSWEDAPLEWRAPG